MQMHGPNETRYLHDYDGLRLSYYQWENFYEFNMWHYLHQTNT